MNPVDVALPMLPDLSTTITMVRLGMYREEGASISTGRAFSMLVDCQPPGPKDASPPTIIRPPPRVRTQDSRISMLRSDRSRAETLSRITASSPE